MPRRFGFLVFAYLALVSYALVVWLPTIVERYESLAEKHPNLAFSYLCTVGLGALVLVVVSLWILIRLLKNTWRKIRLRKQRDTEPGQMSARDKTAEITENLQAGENFARDTSVSEELREEIRKSLKELEAKRTASELEIVAFGTISSGKSSLLNVLSGRQVFKSNVVGGTTSTRSEIPWPGSDKVTLVDTPGLAEVKGESRAAEAALAAKDADLVLLVVDGPLKAYEVDLAEQLLAMEKRIVVCLNKEDWYDKTEKEQLAGQIAEQLPTISAEDIVAVRATTVTRSRMRVASDGSEVAEQIEMQPDVQNLADRLMQIVQRDGRDLLLANLLLQSRGLVDQSKERVRATLDRRAEEIISRHMWAAGGAAGVNPFPLLDLAGGSAITIKMVIELAHVYRQPVDTDMVVKMLEQLGKNLIAMVGATAATPAVAGALGTMLKTVPGIGTIAGGVLQGLVQALVTRWIGNVFMKYFQEEMKTPPGGLAELARSQWNKVTTANSLRKLIQHGRDELMGKSNSKANDD